MNDAPIYQQDNPLLQDAVMQPLVAVFLERLPGRVLEMQVALNEQDWQTLARCAHQIKGTAASFGYPDLTDQAAALEKSLKGGALTSAPGLFAEIKSYVLGID